MSNLKELEDGTFVDISVPTKPGPNGGRVLMTEGDLAAQASEYAAAQNAEQSFKNKVQASLLLEKYSLVVQRAYEAGVPFPQEWKDYGDALRDRASGRSNDPLPTKPSTYPDGTPT